MSNMRGHVAAWLLLALVATTRADIIGESDDEPPEPGTSTKQITPIEQLGDGSYSGYLTDILCWDLRIALDGADMLLEPERHTVHCLRDIQQCIDSGYGLLSLADSGTEYALKYRFDSAGNKAALEYVQSTNKRNNVIVTVRGSFDGDAVKVESIEDYVAPGSAKESMEDVSVRGEAVLFCHFFLMAIAFGALFPWGAALAMGGKKLGGDNPWFQAHRTLQTAGWVMQLAGFVCAVVFAQSRDAHLVSVHTWLGIGVVGLTTIQPFGALLRPHAPAHGEEKSSARALWELLHKSAGYIIVVMGLVTVGLGVAQLNALGYDTVTIGVASGLAVVCGLPPVLYYYFVVVGAGSSLTRGLLAIWGDVQPSAAADGDEQKSASATSSI